MNEVPEPFCSEKSAFKKEINYRYQHGWQHIPYRELFAEGDIDPNTENQCGAYIRNISNQRGIHEISKN